MCLSMLATRCSLSSPTAVVVAGSPPPGCTKSVLPMIEGHEGRIRTAQTQAEVRARVDRDDEEVGFDQTFSEATFLLVWPYFASSRGKLLARR